MKRDGKLRKLLVHSAKASDAGVYACQLLGDEVTFRVDVQAAPLTFVDVKEGDLCRSVQEQQPLVLTCTLSREDVHVLWYKDGAEMQADAHVSLLAEGNQRSVSINSTRLSDAGTYTCRAGDNILYFKVHIREPPVMIVHPKEDVHLERLVPEQVLLSCELSRSNGAVCWFKDGQKLQESENVRLKEEGPYRRLIIVRGGVEDSGEYVCDSAHDSKFFHLNITEAPVRIVSPSQCQMELCQQSSERMVLSCELSRANAAVRWFRDGLQVEENQHLLLEEDGVYRRLVIPQAAVSDSAEYVCDTADDSVTFFVNIAEPPVRFVRPRKMASRVETRVGDTLLLDCEVSRANAEVTWKRNGEDVVEDANVSITEDGVVRQLSVRCVSAQHAGEYVCDAKDDVMDFSVSVQEIPVKILGKSDAKAQKQFSVSDDIILVCELSRSDAVVSWYKDRRLIGQTERHCVEQQGVFRSLVVLNAELSDSGEYVCDAGDDHMGFYITVTEPPVAIVGNAGQAEHHTLLVGDDLVLQCEVSRPDAAVRWLRDGQTLTADRRVSMESQHVARKLLVLGLQPSDSGTYVCDAVDDRLVTIVDVQEPPATFVNKDQQRATRASEGGAVTLSALVSSERASVRWLKGGQDVDGDHAHVSSEGNAHNLTFDPVQLSHAGDYVCDLGTDHMTFTLLVEEVKVRFVRRLQDVVGVKGGAVSLVCELNKPTGDVQWLKDGVEVTASPRLTIRAQGRERSLSVQQLEDADAGRYACESTDDGTVATVTVQTPRVVEFIAELRNITVCEGEDAVFRCVLSPADAHLEWRLNEERVAPGERLHVSSSGLCHVLRVQGCALTDAGRVTAEAEGVASHATLHVQEPQVMFTRRMMSVVGEEFGEATLQVEVSADTDDVRWMRDGVLIHRGAKFSPEHNRHTHTLIIHQLTASDNGNYSCETLHDRTQARVTVEPRRVVITRPLSDITTTERETVTLEVELSHPNVAGRWSRNGLQLKPTNHFRLSAKGRVHSLTVCNLSLEDSASFVFSVDQQQTSARLQVKEPPVTIFRRLEDRRLPEGATLSLECELSRHNVDVKWTKNGEEVTPTREVRVYAVGRKRFLQIPKCRVSDSGVYSCDAKDATTGCSVDVYERELTVLQELQDLHLHEEQNAVFVCELSVEDVHGLWFRNGEEIHHSASIRTRQEGKKHFLLMCNVRAEDSGRIRFVARHVESVASLEVKELPVSIVKPLQDKSALEKTRVIMDCTVSNPRCSCRWYKGPSVVLPSERFEISSEGCFRKLIIQQVALEDEGTYSVQVGEHACSARLTVEAQSVQMCRQLSDVQVSVGDDATFECEVSPPTLQTAAWSLKGEPLRSGPRVRVERMGPVHRLTLRNTCEEMRGVVEFTLGKAKSSAKLHVTSDL